MSLAVQTGLCLLLASGSLFSSCSETEREKREAEVRRAISKECGTMHPYFVGCAEGNTCFQVQAPDRSRRCIDLFMEPGLVRTVFDEFNCSYYDAGIGPGSTDRFRMECGSAKLGPLVSGQGDH